MIKLLAAPSFHSASGVIPLIAATVFLHGIIHVSNALYLIKRQLPRTLKWWIIGGTLSLLLNGLLIPDYGIWGAAWSQVLGFSAIAGGMAIDSQKIYPLQFNWKRSGILCFSIVLLSTFLIPVWSSAPLIDMLLKLPIGLMVVLIVFRVLEPEAIAIAFEKISQIGASIK